jgi:hypothetical protein
MCAVSEVLCSVSQIHYIEYDSCSVSDEEKGRRALTTHVSYRRKGRHALAMRVLHMRQRETVYIRERLPFT